MSQNIDAVIADGSNGAGTNVADQILIRAEARRLKAMQNGLEIAKALNLAADSLGWDDEEVNRNLKILLDNKMDLDIITGMEDKTILAFNLSYSLIARVKANHIKFQTNMMLNPHMTEMLLRQSNLSASQLLNNVNNIVAPTTPPIAALETRFPSFSGYPMLATPNTSLEDQTHPKPEIENDRPTKKQKLTGLTKESIEQKIRKNQRIMDSFPEGAEFEVISESKFFCKLCKSTIKIQAGDISGITEHCYGKFSKGSNAAANNNNGKTSKHWARVLALKDGHIPAVTKIGKLQRKNRREESQKQGKVLCYCLQEVGMVQGKKGLLFRCSQVNRCQFKRRAESDINAVSEDEDIDDTLQAEEQQPLHLDSAMNLMFSQLLQQQSYGQLAIGPKSSHVPVNIPLPVGIPVSQVDCGFYHSLVLLEDGSLYSWGRSMEGQLGLGKDEATKFLVAEPTKIKIEFNPVQISCGRYHTMVLNQHGQVFETGRDTEYTFSLVKMPMGDKIQQIASGGVWSYVLTITGDVYRWGGLVKEENRTVTKLQDIPALASLVGGFGAVTGLTQTGDVWRYGDQGSVTSTQNLVRMEVSGLNTAASLDVSGILTAWKCDPVTRKPISSPADVGGVFAGHYGREVAAGDHHVVVLGAHVTQKTPRVFCFGTSNSFGQLGNPSEVPVSQALMFNPISINPLDGAELSQVRCGGYHTLVLAGNWIGGNTGLANEMRAARTGELLTDMEFHVDGTVFKAHKAIVSARSLRHEQCTLKVDLKTSAVVKIEGVTPQEFAQFMEFLYTDSCPIDRAQITGLQKLADMFGTDRLKLLLRSDPQLNKKKTLHEVPRLADDLGELLSSGDFSDISFDVDGTIVRAHKFVLAARCPYYNALWRQGWQESAQSVLHLGEELSAVSFKHFLKYIYTDIFDMDGDSVVDVLRLSHKIQVSSLKNLCERFVSGSVEAENVCGLYQLAAELNSVAIKNVCLKCIKKVGLSSVKKDFEDLPEDLRKEIAKKI